MTQQLLQQDKVCSLILRHRWKSHTAPGPPLGIRAQKAAWICMQMLLFSLVLHRSHSCFSSLYLDMFAISSTLCFAEQQIELQSNF